jgi:predicted acylesterase/phospholipase RssA
LDTLERELGSPISNWFDLIAGTSTGGILAIGLSLPNSIGLSAKYTANDMIDLYKDHGLTIFPRAGYIQNLITLNKPRYSEDGINQVLDRFFGINRLSQCSTNVLITSYDTQSRMPVFFKSWDAKKNAGKDHLVKDIARATSAAPVYFPASLLRVDTAAQHLSLVDGGVVANNPAMCAYMESLVLGSNELELLMVSLGTGKLKKSLPFDQVKNWGPIQWVGPLIDTFFDASSDVTDHQMDLLAESGVKPIDYYRFQQTLRGQTESMDNAEAQNIKDLVAIAQEMLDEKKDLMRRLVKALKKEGPRKNT